MEDAEGEFEQDEFVQENATAHVGDGDCDHDDDAAYHVALGPCGKSEASRSGWFRDEDCSRDVIGHHG